MWCHVTQRVTGEHRLIKRHFSKQIQIVRQKAGQNLKQGLGNQTTRISETRQSNPNRINTIRNSKKMLS